MFVLCISLLLFSFYVQRGHTIKPINSCKCELDSGQVIDLENLARTDGQPRFLDLRAQSPPTDTFSYNPCKGFDEGNCKDVAICQTRQKLQYNAGDHDGVSCLYDATNGYYLQYQSDDPVENVKRVTSVYLVCDHTKDGDLYVQGELVASTYLMFLTSKYACPFTPGLSVGTILLIAFICCVFVYFIAGVIFQTFKRGAKGKERIPHYSIWIQLPSLVKDGSKFVITKITMGKYQRI